MSKNLFLSFHPNCSNICIWAKMLGDFAAEEQTNNHFFSDFSKIQWENLKCWPSFSTCNPPLPSKPSSAKVNKYYFNVSMDTSIFLVIKNRGTQRIVSVNYLFGRSLIPYDFLKGIFTSNFRDVGNLSGTVCKTVPLRFGSEKRLPRNFAQ